MARLKDFYYAEVVEAMTKKFGYKNVMEVPKLDKIVINMDVVLQIVQIDFRTGRTQMFHKIKQLLLS